MLLIYSILVRLFGHEVQPGWASIMVAITFFSGIQLLGLGIVGQYMARIYDESKNRPIYIVKDEYNIQEANYIIGNSIKKDSMSDLLRQ